VEQHRDQDRHLPGVHRVLVDLVEVGRALPEDQLPVRHHDDHPDEQDEQVRGAAHGD
jgi:hypothetical protein